MGPQIYRGGEFCKSNIVDLAYKASSLVSGRLITYKVYIAYSHSGKNGVRC